MFVLFGCNKINKVENELQIFGLHTENIEKIEIIHGNIIIYPDKEQKDNLTVIEEVNSFFDNMSDRIEILDEDLDIMVLVAEGYAQNDAENYYVYITFSNPQTLNFKNSSIEEFPNCDSVIFDINNMKLHWSEDGNFKGTLGYASNTTSAEIELSTLFNQIESLFVD